MEKIDWSEFELDLIHTVEIIDSLKDKMSVGGDYEIRLLILDLHRRIKKLEHLTEKEKGE